MASNLIFKRCLSSTTHLAQQVRPPIQVYGIEGKYASALYSTAYKQKALETVDKDLHQIKELYNTHKDFNLFVNNPTLNRNKKAEAVKAVLKKIGVSEVSQNFVGLLAENGRLNKLNAVFNSFESIMRAYRGELYVEVTSAEPLSKKHEQSLKDALQKFATNNQVLKLNFSVKPSILGGLVVTVGDKYIDLSVSTRLKKMTDSLQHAL